MVKKKTEKADDRRRKMPGQSGNGNKKGKGNKKGNGKGPSKVTNVKMAAASRHRP